MIVEDKKLVKSPQLVGPEGGLFEGELGTDLENVKLEIPSGAFEVDAIVAIELGNKQKFEEALLDQAVGAAIR